MNKLKLFGLAGLLATSIGLGGANIEQANAAELEIPKLPFSAFDLYGDGCRAKVTMSKHGYTMSIDGYSQRAGELASIKFTPNGFKNEKTWKFSDELELTFILREPITHDIVWISVVNQNYGGGREEAVDKVRMGYTHFSGNGHDPKIVGSMRQWALERLVKYTNACRQPEVHEKWLSTYGNELRK